MKKFIIFLFLLTAPLALFGADSEVQDLGDIAAPAVGDDLYIVDDPDGTPASKKISVGVLLGVSPALDNDGTITDDYIDSADYAAGSIDAEHLAADIIDETKIADNGIDSEHYNDGSIDNAHLANDAVNSEEIATNAVKLDALDVSDVSDDIAGDIAEGELADSIVVSADIKDDTIDSADYAAGSIDAEHLAADIVDETKIADNGIDSEHYNDGSIDAEHLAADVVDETKIADDGIDSEHYNDASIDPAHLNIANAEVDEYVLSYEADTTNYQWKEMTGGAEVNNLETVMTDVLQNEIAIGQSGGDVGGYYPVTGDITMDDFGATTIGNDKVDSAHYNAESIDAEHLAGDIVDESKIADDGIDSEHYNDGSIDAVHHAADSITHTQILDADQADTKCIWFEDPIATDDFNSIWANKTANDFLLTEIWAESDQTVTFMLQVDDGTPADVDSVDLAPAAGEAEDVALDGDTTVAAGEELDLAVTSVAGTPTWCSICWTGNWVD